MGRNEYDKEREREKDANRERPVTSRSKSRSASHSPVYKKRKHSESPKRDRDSYERKRSDRKDNNDKYYRRSRSPRVKYKRKTSRDNSAENSGNVLYVSNLSRRVKDEEIIEKFSKCGKVTSVHVVRDPFTKESRGFGFVTMDNEKDAKSALQGMNKTEIDGKEVNVEISKRNRPHHSTPGVYLGPTSTSSIRRKPFSPKRRYSRRSRSRSRSRSYHRDRNYRKPKSRSRSGSYRGRKY